MLRYSVNNDIKGLISLWHESFGDSEKEIYFFLNRCFLPQNTLVYEINNEIASMLFLLDGEMVIDGTCYPSYYLYAACTSKKYRGRGLMASLLSFAKETAQKRGFSFICLMPGEKSLFEFYEKHGYKDIFKRKILKISRAELDENNYFVSFKDKVDFSSLRNFAFNGLNYFKWSNSAIKFAVDHTVFYGGAVVKFCNGYSLYNVIDNTIHVKEFAFSSFDFKSVLSVMASDSNAENLIVYLPADYETSIGEYEIKECAMMLAVNDNAEKIMKKIDTAYLGLTLD